MVEVKKMEDEEEHIAKDGETITVPFMMMDGQQKEVRQLIDSKTLPALNTRPGFAQMPAGDAERRHKMYADADKKLSERWKNPPAATQDAAAKPAPIKQGMAALYDRRDKALSERWRGAR